MKNFLLKSVKFFIWFLKKIQVKTELIGKKLLEKSYLNYINNYI